MPTYHSEHGQDRWLHENVFHDQRGGTFVEFGALDGLIDSNSLFFERELGWTGLLIEANPDAFAKLVQNRPGVLSMHAAIYDRHGSVAFERIGGGLFGWSGITETIEPQHRARIDTTIPDALREQVAVPCIPLARALDIAKLTAVDYLSMDVEGAEYKILAVFPFEKYRIKVFGIEDNFGNHPIAALMESKGYVRIGRVGVDTFYRLRDDAP